ncbi:MAG: glutathione S-transferase family protein [Oceanospirillales bacterium]|nr:glutathione S-transferase family protein [Oceanospirillales bacterium]MBR9887063.1 glutathione S-transferase family protein [Oceanospirillales bacterium]
MIKVYGGVYSRANMVMCVLETLGIAYENIPMAPRSESTRSPEYLALNPTGKLPTLVDGDLVLWESQAILFYLARKYGDGLLWVDTLEQEADLYRWSLFISNQLEVPALDMLLAVKYAQGEPDQSFLAAQTQILERFLPVLEVHLQNSEYLAGGKLTVADFHGAAVISWPKVAGFDYSTYPAVDRWVSRIQALPVQEKVRQQA